MTGAADRVRGRRTLALIALLGLLAVGCGTRVDDDIRLRAAAAALQGPGTNGTIGTTDDGGSTVIGGGPVTGGTGPISIGPAIPTGPGANPNTPPVDNGGATDVGVTATTITLGSVSDLSGPVPGLFEGAVNGTLAYFAHINSLGGVHGRTLHLTAADGQTDCGQNQNQHRQLIDDVFAFVGSFSLYDDCGAKVLAQHPKVSEVSYALSPSALKLPNYFSPSPLPPGYPTGMFEYWKDKFGDAVTHAASMSPNVPAAEAAWLGIRSAAESVGWVFEYVRKYGPTEQRFDADVVRMQRQGIELIYLNTSEVAQVAQIKQAADQQNYHPIFVSPLAYAEDFVDLVGGPEAAEGIYGATLYPLFFSASDAARIPAVATFQHWMRQVRPGSPVNLFAMYSWSAAQLFVQALRAAGPRATRASLQAELKKVKSFDAGGLLPPRNPAAKTASPCYIIWRYIDGDFRRQDTPASGYRCDGRYHHYKA